MGKVKVLLDTNIVLDYFTGRMGDGLAAKIVQIGKTSQYEMCVSFLTAINTMYVARKLNSQLRPTDISLLFTILAQDSKQWDDASSLEMSDFEDASQASCALNNGCFIAISRDRHFDNAPMAVVSPEKFIELVCE